MWIELEGSPLLVFGSIYWGLQLGPMQCCCNSLDSLGETCLRTSKFPILAGMGENTDIVLAKQNDALLKGGTPTS